MDDTGSNNIEETQQPHDGEQEQGHENGREKEEKRFPTTAVRYGKMNHLGQFTYPPSINLNCGDYVVVSTDRGIELGQQVELACQESPNRVPCEQMLRYAEASGEEAFRLNAGRILRVANEADFGEVRHIEGALKEKLEICKRFAQELNLDLKVVDCEHILGGERIVFYFMAEERVDFRELVRRLAGEFQTRIEMRQIGARDEARLLADFETCGRECCCKNFLKTLKPISMSMAKLQKTTLDVAKVSGRCGRLKCCLRYEHETYQDLERRLPKNGTRITTGSETGIVIDRQIITQLIKIRTDDDRLVVVPVEDIIETGSSEQPLPANVEQLRQNDDYPSTIIEDESAVISQIAENGSEILEGDYAVEEISDDQEVGDFDAQSEIQEADVEAEGTGTAAQETTNDSVEKQSDRNTKRRRRGRRGRRSRDRRR